MTVINFTGTKSPCEINFILNFHELVDKKHTSCLPVVKHGSIGSFLRFDFWSERCTRGICYTIRLVSMEM